MSIQLGDRAGGMGKPFICFPPSRDGLGCKWWGRKGSNCPSPTPTFTLPQVSGTACPLSPPLPVQGGSITPSLS